MIKKNVPDIKDVYDDLVKWFNDGKGEKIIEIGVYNDYVKYISYRGDVIIIELKSTDTWLCINQDEVKKLKIDKKYGMLTFSI